MADTSPYPVGDKRGAIPPLDLSGFAAKKLDYSKLFQSIQPGGVSGVDTSDLAKAILANSKWGGQNGQVPGAPHKESLWNKITDLLSMGLYTTAGAFEKGLDAHQKSGHNSVLSDIVDTGGAALGGFLDGIGGAAFPILGLGGRTNDSNKIEWAQVLAKHGPYAKELQTGMTNSDPGDPNAPDVPVTQDQIKYDSRRTAALGLLGDIALDPLNFTKLFKGSGAIDDAIKGAKPAAQVVNDTAGVIPDGLEVSNDSKMANQVVTNPLGDIPAAQDIPNVNPVATKPFDPPVAEKVAFNIPDIPKTEGINNAELFNQMLGETKAEYEAGKVSEAQKIIDAKASRLANPARRIALVKPLVLRASQHPDAGSWARNVVQNIDKAFPGLEIRRTKAYLNSIVENPRMFEGLQKTPKGVQGVTDALSRTLEEDWKASRGASEAQKVAKKAKPLTVPAQKIVDAIMAKRGAGISDEAGRVLLPLSADDQRIADEVTNAFKNQVETGHYSNMPQAVERSIASGATRKWGGPKQVNMWQTILAKIPYAAKHERALKILRNVEQTFIDQGHIPYSTASAAHAIPLRLSDIIAAVGPKEFVKHADLATTLLRSAFSHNPVKGAAEAANKAPELDAAIKQAVTEAAAKGAVQEADAAKLGATAGDKAAEQALQSDKSDARISNDINIAGKVAQDIAAKAGAGVKGQKLAREIVKSVYVDSNKVQSTATRNALNTKTALTHNVLKPEWNSNSAITKAIKETIGGESPRVLGQLSNPTANAIGWQGARVSAALGLFDSNFSKLVDFFGSRFNPAYGNADLRPILLQQLGSARATATHNSNVWAQAVKQIGTDPDLWDNAMKGAQGLKILELDHPATPAMKLILQHMENLVGSSGLSDSALSAMTVAGRSQLLMKELNEALIRSGLKQFAFTNGKAVKDALGNTKDYSRGIDWLDSWESWAIDNPPRFMINLSNAIHNTVHEANFWNDIAERYGAKVRRGAQSNQPSSGVAVNEIERLRGYRFSNDVAAQIRQVAHNLEQMKKPSSKQFQLFDKVLTKWKTAVTIYMPAHHIRNALGDTFMNWLAGVNNPGVYTDALKVMRAQHGRYKAIENTSELTGYDVVQKAIERSKNIANGVKNRGDQVVFSMKNGQHVTSDMIYASAFKRGILPTTNMLEDIPEEDASLLKALSLSPFNGRVRGWINDATEGREHFIRLAHYIDVLRKSSGDFEKASENAANIVRRWHPDGSDLTDFERRVVRRLLPFYSWTRKATPLMIESIAMHPLKVTAYNKAMYALQVSNSQGDISGTTWEQPFPVDQLFPDWLRNKGIGPQLGSGGSYTIVNPSNPVLDVVDQLSDPGFALTGMLNPALKIPLELAMGQQMSGSQINADNGGISSYLAKQLPGISQFGNISNLTDTGAQQRYAQQTGNTGVDIPALINLILAGGVTDTSKYQKQGQHDLRDYLKAQNGG